MGWLRDLLRPGANRRWSREELRDRSLAADMAQARADGRPPPGEVGDPRTVCKRYVPNSGYATPCEWPYCTCTAGSKLVVHMSNSVASPSADPQRPCHGCGHSAAMTPFPGAPSGERPCLFCVRNPQQATQLAQVQAGLNPGVAFTARYDNGPTRTEVADQYIATDRLRRDLPADTVAIT